MHSGFKIYLLHITHSNSFIESEIIQPLWSGYGKISRFKLSGSNLKTVVVKHISLGDTNAHPRGWNTDLSHLRKVKSYQVETYWYEKWNQRCNANCKTPNFLGSYSSELNQWIILEDLDREFPVRKSQISFSEVKSCLKWLANFHAVFLNHEPTRLWNIGTYWHLETRPDELQKLEHSELKKKAHLIDKLLNDCIFKTIVHGDAKLANFCFSNDGKQIAAVDFQYAGGGCGMKDVAYFLGSCLSGSECERYEEEFLKFYFSELKTALDSLEVKLDFNALQNEWKQLYPVACADFMRFLLGWMPTHQKINDYNLKKIEEVLALLETF